MKPTLFYSLTAVAVALIVPSAGFAHVTIGGLQPGPFKTAARTSYLLRAPNEKDKQNTIRLEVTVPAAVQNAISVKKVAGWKVKLTTEGSGEAAKITKIVYTATKAAEIPPHFYEEWPLRIQNPATAGAVCFPVLQIYRGLGGGTETVAWTGDTGSDLPAPCITVVE